MPSGSSDPASPFTLAPGGLRLALRLTPKAARERIGPVVREADGAAVLKAAVTAVAEHGKANDALLRLLAKAWRLPKTSISIIGGTTDRRKLLFLAGDGAVLKQRLEAWIREPP